VSNHASSWLVSIFALFMCFSPWHSYGTGPSFKKPQNKISPYSLEYEIIPPAKDVLTINFFNMTGFDKIVIENVSSDSETATVFSRMSLIPGSATDESKSSNISIILPIVYQPTDPYLHIRVRKSKETPDFFCIKFIPPTTSMTGKVACGTGDPHIESAPGCPTWCYWAYIISYPTGCLQVKCCQYGNILYDLNNCTITCLGGDCSD